MSKPAPDLAGRQHGVSLRHVATKVLRALRRLLHWHQRPSRADVAWAFRLLLGRDPESEAVIDAHRGAVSIRDLVDSIGRSHEFSMRTASPMRGASPLPAPGPVVPTHRSRRETGSVVLVSGNCNHVVLAAALQRLTDACKVHAVATFRLDEAGARQALARHAADADVWIASPRDTAALSLFKESHAAGARLITVPAVRFPAFHPDCCDVRDRRTGRRGPRLYNSAIVAWAYANGLDVARTLRLFDRELLRALGYLDAWAPSAAGLRQAFEATDMADAYTPFLRRVQRQGCFMHTSNHPRIETVVELAVLVAAKAGLAVTRTIRDGEMVDPMNGVVWPVYPDIAWALGVPGGSWHWKFIESGEYFDDLPSYVEDAFAGYASHQIAPEDLEIQFPPLGAMRERVLRDAAGIRA